MLGLAIPTELNENPSVNCEWQTYYVNKPIIDIELAESSGGETYRSAACKNRDIPRYDAWEKINILLLLTKKKLNQIIKNS